MAASVFAEAATRIAESTNKKMDRQTSPTRAGRVTIPNFVQRGVFDSIVP